MNIVLIGYMASGKTTIGKALALKMQLEFLDTDEIIERQQSLSIKEIFSNHGEEYFRELERLAIQQLLGLDGYVIAVGGGAVMFYDNLKNLKRLGTTVFLDAPLQKIIDNLKGSFRPLIGNTINENKISELLNSRYPTYCQADLIINTADLNIQQTVDEIAEKLGQ